jgi:hypothetical protein
MAGPVIDDRETLEVLLTKLGAPPLNCIRVYRGQTQDFGHMLPTGLRGKPMRSEHIFREYTAMLASTLEAREEGAVNYLLWTRVIAQHYGPGSSLLDVTHSVEVALWFSLHRLDSISSRHTFGPTGPLDTRTDHQAESEVFTHIQVQEGILYVFDVPVGRPNEPLTHGALLDTATAPLVFASCPRIKTQAASLVYADPKLVDADLRTFYACPPIRVGRPMSGYPGTNADTSQMFPGASEDPWYAKLVAIPWSNRLDLLKKSVSLKPAIPVNLYIDPTKFPPPLWARLIVTPPLNVLADAMSGIDWCQDPPNEILRRHPLANTTRILLEAPVMATTPAVSTDQWSESLLASNVPDRIESVGPDASATTQIDLKNVFLELSPLEHVGWDAVERGTPLDALRAIWVVREGPTVVMSYFFQSWPTPGNLTGVGGIELRYDTGRRRFHLLNPPEGDNDWLRGDEHGQKIFKRFLTAMWILGCCNPDSHFAAFPQSVGRGSDGALVTVVPWFEGAEAQLIAATDWDGSRCYVPRMVQSGFEFYTPFDGIKVVVRGGDGRFANLEVSTLEANLRIRPSD